MNTKSKSAGKYITIDPNNPHGAGVCDDSGFVFNHKDLVKQMEWRGNNLVWTGLMIGKPFLDVPSQQNRPPLSKRDPIPIKNARLPEDYIDSDSNPALPSSQLINKLNNIHWGN